MKSKVYFTNLRADSKRNLLDKLSLLLKKAGLTKVIDKNSFVAIKLHFGEKGNLAYIRPPFVRRVVEEVKKQGGKPFITDANTLYVGSRSDAIAHIQTAIENGFGFSAIGAPILIADGLRGTARQMVVINKKHFKRVAIGSEVVAADSLISLAHFKAHELAGFGGTIKNVGMGCASRKGKLEQHSNISPKVNIKKCEGCRRCIKYCAHKAIKLIDEKASILSEKCVGCGECIIICPNEAIQIQWNESIPIFLEKMVEYTLGVLKGKKERSIFVNFLTQISPACDCYGHNDFPIVEDIGILASRDPVAIDKASVDLVNMKPGIKNSALKKAFEPGSDKFRDIYPKVDYSLQFDYAEEIGLGSKEYELIEL